MILKESNAYKKTAEGIAAARTRTSSMWNSATASVSASTGKMFNLLTIHSYSDYGIS